MHQIDGSTGKHDAHRRISRTGRNLNGGGGFAAETDDPGRSGPLDSDQAVRAQRQTGLIGVRGIGQKLAEIEWLNLGEHQAVALREMDVDSLITDLGLAGEIEAEGQDGVTEIRSVLVGCAAATGREYCTQSKGYRPIQVGMQGLRIGRGQRRGEGLARKPAGQTDRCGRHAHGHVYIERIACQLIMPRLGRGNVDKTTAIRGAALRREADTRRRSIGFDRQRAEVQRLRSHDGRGSLGRRPRERAQEESDKPQQGRTVNKPARPRGRRCAVITGKPLPCRKSLYRHRADTGA